ncbi:winged helix-turn-helix domain-containing protein [Pseudomonas entomophila]|uniref:winged helix-turn-helix domain-containing protein n=1 Tax=Pseudomonas entomophila TaxID=312306 RepID=UPI003EBC70B6
MTAQGFNKAGNRDRAPDPARLRRVIRHLGLLQIDSVNVLARAHYLPLYARLGAYERADLDRLMVERPKRFFEYWGHEASLLPVDCHPLLRWRMARARAGQGIWRPLRPFATERRGEAEALLAHIAAHGPLAASDLASATARPKGMWAWSDTKHALEWLFWAGLVAASYRRSSFERVYDLPERVLPRVILETPTPPAEAAHRALLARAAQALGVATAGDLRDYYRLPAADVPVPLAQLVEDGTLTPVRVQGWRQPAYLHRDARAGRRLSGATLLSPFDPLIWHRDRTERLFDFRYRLEIYTPAHQREHGYYVLPVLLDGALVARVDLKAERREGRLVVRQASLEPGAGEQAVEALQAELHRMAGWLKLATVDSAVLDIRR